MKQYRGFNYEKCFGVWWGGANYSIPEHGNYEEFSSVEDAKEDFVKKYNNQGYPLTPCVTDEAETFIYFNERDAAKQDVPVFIIKFYGGEVVISDVCCIRSDETN